MIQDVRGPLSYEVKLTNGTSVCRHVDHIRTRVVSNSPADDENVGVDTSQPDPNWAYTATAPSQTATIPMEQTAKAAVNTGESTGTPIVVDPIPVRRSTRI